MTNTNRPATLAGFVGQAALVRRLRLVMSGAQARGTRPPHVLLSGPAGMGKTTLARIVADQLGAPLVVASGPSLRRPGDIVSILASIEEGDIPTVVFIDEIHRLPIAVEETLYEALEDGTVTRLVGPESSQRALTLRLAPFVCVGATTQSGKLSKPLRDRFGFSEVMAPYSVEELGEITIRAWAREGYTGTPEAALAVASRSKGVPRVAIHLAARVLDTLGSASPLITAKIAIEALAQFGIGARGLTERDVALLRVLVTAYAGRAVGLDALAQAVDSDAATVERENEPYLVREGLVTRTPSGRMATAAAFEFVRSLPPVGASRGDTVAP